MILPSRQPLTHGFSAVAGKFTAAPAMFVVADACPRKVAASGAAVVRRDLRRDRDGRSGGRQSVSVARRPDALRQRELRIVHKSFTINDLLKVCQPWFPRSFPHRQRESSGPCKPVADESGTTPDRPRASSREAQARRPSGCVLPAGMETRGPSAQDRPHHVQRIPHRVGRPPALDDRLHRQRRSRSRSTERNESIAAPPR